MLNKKKIDSQKNRFLKLTGEDEKLNQYWFSEKTIEFLANQCEKHGKTVAFIAVPSLFFSVSADMQNNGALYDLDKAFLKKHKNAVVYDFNDFSNITTENKFDMVVIDPPFITEMAWTLFANFAKQIGRKDENGNLNCKILTCSIAENKDMLKGLLGLEIKNYKPSIPHLVYQYNFYSNYTDEQLDSINDEIID